MAGSAFGVSPPKKHRGQRLAGYRRGVWFYLKTMRFSTHAPPKGSRGRAESPLVASAEAKPSPKQKKGGRLFPCPPQEICFWWEVSSACGRTRYFPRAGKYPKGAGGGQRVHVSWPPPDPPLLRNSAPLASQGRAQLGSRPSLGGPLSPSAQLIPPPAPQRRSILGVSARDRHGSTPMQRYVSRHRGHARCVPTSAPDWLLAQNLAKWHARYGPCRSRHKGTYPFRYKGGPGVSLGRLKGV